MRGIDPGTGFALQRHDKVIEIAPDFEIARTVGGIFDADFIFFRAGRGACFKDRKMLRIIIG